MMQPRVGRLVVNILSNWSGQFLTIGIGFFLAPFVVRSLGDEAYGVWILMMSVSGYLALFDLGVRSAVTRYVARFAADGQHETVARVASSALKIFLIAGATATLLSLALAVFAVDRFIIPGEYRTAARVVFALAGLNIGVSLVGGTYGAVLAAMQRFDLLNLVDVATALLRALATVVALAAGQGLVSMAVIQLALTLLRSVWLAGLSRRVYPALRVNLGAADREHIRLIFSFSVLSFIIHISGRVIYYTDAVVVAAFLPIGLLTFFAIASSLVDYARTLISSVSYTTSPMASALDGVGDHARVRKLLLDHGSFSTMILLPVAVTFLIRGASFVGLWMGPSYSGPSGQVLAILTLPLLLHGGAHGLGGIMLGIGKHKPMVPAMLVEAGANLALSIVLARSMGLTGVAWGTAIPSILSSFSFWPWYVQRTLGIPVGRYAAAVWLRPAIAVLPFAGCTYLVEHVWPAATLAAFFAQVAVCVLVAIGAYWQACLTAEQREQAVEMVSRRFRRSRVELPAQ